MKRIILFLLIIGGAVLVFLSVKQLLRSRDPVFLPTPTTISITPTLFPVLTPTLIPTDTVTPICVDRCGDGICQEIVCLATGCPCSENPQTCPQDCH